MEEAVVSANRNRDDGDQLKILSGRQQEDVIAAPPPSFLFVLWTRAAPQATADLEPGEGSRRKAVAVGGLVRASVTKLVGRGPWPRSHGLGPRSSPALPATVTTSTAASSPQQIECWKMSG